MSIKAKKFLVNLFLFISIVMIASYSINRKYFCDSVDGWGLSCSEVARYSSYLFGFCSFFHFFTWAYGLFCFKPFSFHRREIDKTAVRFFLLKDFEGGDYE